MVQIEPGPIPTFKISAPSLYNLRAASPVAIFPTQTGVLELIFFILPSIFMTFSLCPCAVSITIRSTPASRIDFALNKSSLAVPTAAPVIKFLLF